MKNKSKNKLMELILAIYWHQKVFQVKMIEAPQVGLLKFGGVNY